MKNEPKMNACFLEAIERAKRAMCFQYRADGTRMNDDLFLDTIINLDKLKNFISGIGKQIE